MSITRKWGVYNGEYSGVAISDGWLGIGKTKVETYKVETYIEGKLIR